MKPGKVLFLYVFVSYFKGLLLHKTWQNSTGYVCLYKLTNRNFAIM